MMTQMGDDRLAAVHETISARLLEHGVPSLAVAVAQRDTILWEEAFGWADRERRVVATPHTMYSLTSISKPITATALMVLVERGGVDVYRPIDDYLGSAKLTAHLGDARDAPCAASVDIGPGLAAYAAGRYGADGQPYPFYDFDHPGGSAVFCSAHDLVRFGMFQLKAHLADQRAILHDVTIDAMQQRTTPAGGDGYGVGWSVKEDQHGYATVSHAGGMGGVNTQLALVPSEGLAVVTLANAASPLPFLVADEILDALLPRCAERRARQQAKQKQQPESPLPTPRRPSCWALGTAACVRIPVSCSSRSSSSPTAMCMRGSGNS
jgi:CubicO group peptidase (beta-lactamase class C family)